MTRRPACGAVLLLAALGLAACGSAETAEPAGRRYRVEAIAENRTGTTVVSADEDGRGRLTHGEITPLSAPGSPDASSIWHYDAAFIRAHCPCTFETTGDSREVRVIRERREVAPEELPPLPEAIRLPAYVKRLPQERESDR